MTELAQLQTEFRRYLLDRDPPVQARVIGTERVDAATRLAIYANAYGARLVEALDANYPALHHWLGDEQFNRLGTAYLNAHPSQHYSIRWFGHRLPEFMNKNSPWCEDAFSTELAHFEWAMSEAFDSADAKLVIADEMTALSPDTWPTLRFTLHASVRQLTLHWNVPTIWRALTRDEKPETPKEAEPPVCWLVWREQLALFYRALEVDEARALGAAGNGASFAEICEGLCEWIEADHVAARAAWHLRQWITDGLIVKLRN